MKPWSALLESFHSALIDEITERHPEPKPELGLPIRQHGMQVPDPSIDEIIAHEVYFEEDRGTVLVAFDNLGRKAVGVTAKVFWESLLQKAVREFELRRIAPRIGAPVPQGGFSANKTIWIPIRVSGGKCLLGLSV